MTKKAKPNEPPKLTDEERHKRFVDTAREIGADESQEAFDMAFNRIIHGKKTTQGKESQGE